MKVNQSNPLVTILHEHQEISLPAFICIVSGTCVLVLAIVVYCTWRCWQSKHESSSAFSTPGVSPVSSRKSLSVKISQSTPDLADDLKGDLNHDINGKGFKTVFRQTTLPTVPQRHQSFQRQLSHKLDYMSNTDFPVQKVQRKTQPELGQIKPELYHDSVGKDSNPVATQHVKTCGKLHFALQYSHEQQTLIVTILRAEGLPAKDFSGTSDPYVKVYLLPDRKKKYHTKVHRKTLNPQFNETFRFVVPCRELMERVLQFSLYDFDRFSRHDLIGIVLARELGKDRDLCNQQQYSMDILCVAQEKISLGELMLSLCYLPTAGRLTVTIIKARNLSAMDVTGAADPYVKVSLMCRGKRIRKKKTSVKKSTLNPVYNEALVFDVPHQNVEEVCLIIRVIDYDRVGSNEAMGCCGVGPQCIGVGRDHWFEMLENPRKPVAQWYPLIQSLPGFSNDNTPNGKNKDK